MLYEYESSTRETCEDTHSFASFFDDREWDQSLDR